MNSINQKQEIGNHLAYLQCQNALKALALKINLPVEKMREIDRRNAEAFGVCPIYIQ